MLEPGELKKLIEDDVYPNKDMHMLYYGEVKACYATEDADNELA
jgi:hypothetical protein